MGKVYQFYAELMRFNPKIWRRFQVSDDISVDTLADIVMTMYRMDGSHMYMVEEERLGLTKTGRVSRGRAECVARYGVMNEYADEVFFDCDACEKKVSDIRLGKRTSLIVNYDFGDNWQVKVTLEETLDAAEVPADNLPRVLEGWGYGIVEDCGGVWGLARLVEAFKEKSGEQYEDLREWLQTDEFDIGEFDIDGINESL